MLHRSDPNLLVEGYVVLAENDIQGETWRGLSLRAGSAFTIRDVRRFVNFRAFPQTCGWMVTTPAKLELRLSFLPHRMDEALSARTFSGAFQPVTLPWPTGYFGRVDLRVDVIGLSRGSVFLANHRALFRDWLLELAVGNGVEIGPGPQPQVLPRPGVTVSYVEQSASGAWNARYNKSGKHPVRPDLWNNYIVGDAADLPVADRSLNFIFGSHVFEHLTNPIGHLAAWKRKLAPEGKVICIVPDLGGTKDAVQERSTFEELQEEFERGVWRPAEAHYVRHFGLPAGHERVRAAIEQAQSIHSHYYDNINCQLLLDFAVNRLGYEEYVIEHTPNHKDFHFVLKNS